MFEIFEFLPSGLAHRPRFVTVIQDRPDFIFCGFYVTVQAKDFVEKRFYDLRLFSSPFLIGVMISVSFSFIFWPTSFATSSSLTKASFDTSLPIMSQNLYHLLRILSEVICAVITQWFYASTRHSGLPLRSSYDTY